MRLSGFAGLVAGLTAAALTSQAGAQSFSRRIDLLRLQDEAMAAAAAVFQTSGKSCNAEFARLRTFYADPRFDRMAVDTRRTTLFAVMVCAESRDLPFAVEAARRLEPIAREPVEISAVHSVQISEALQRGARAEAARLFLTLTDKQPRVVAGWDPEMVSPFADYIEGDPELSLRVAERLSTLDWTNDASRRAAHNAWALSWGWQLADRGRLAEAGAAVDKADELYVLLMVAGDRRFAQIWDRYARPCAPWAVWTRPSRSARPSGPASRTAKPSRISPASRTACSSAWARRCSRPAATARPRRCSPRRSGSGSRRSPATSPSTRAWPGPAG
jgi:hypothetical protein